MKHKQLYFIFFFFLWLVPNIFSQEVDFVRFQSSAFENVPVIRLEPNCQMSGPSSFPIKVSDLPILNGSLQFDRIELGLHNFDINYVLEITLVSPNGTIYTIADTDGLGSWPSLSEGRQAIYIFNCPGLYPDDNSPMVQFDVDGDPQFGVNGYEMPNMTDTDPNGIWSLQICNRGNEEIEILSTNLIFKSKEVYGGVNRLSNAPDCDSNGTLQYFVSMGGCDAVRHFFIGFDEGPLEYGIYDPLDINGIISNREFTPGNHVIHLYGAIDAVTPDYTHERTYNFFIGVDFEDTEPPVLINCPADTMYYFTVNDTVAVGIKLPTFTDNCGVVKATFFTSLLDGLKWADGSPDMDTTDFITFPGIGLGGRLVGTGRARTDFLIADAAGNTATCRTTFTFLDSIACANDTEPPVLINCPSDSIYYSVNDTIVTWITHPTFMDNCQVVTATYLITMNGTTFEDGASGPFLINFIDFPGETNQGTVLGTGTVRLDYSIADAAGNTAVCATTVTITDLNKPTCHVNIGDECVFPGMTALIPVTVDKFKDIFAFQFTLKNPTNAALSLEGIVNLNPTVSNLLFNKLPNGNIIILWDDVQSIARTLPDGTKLFDIVVKATEEFNAPGVITTVGDVVVGGKDPNITLTFKPGNICVQTGVIPKGSIKNPSGKVHAGVKVELIQSGNAVGSVNTGADGSYALGISPLENRVRPTKNDEIKKGITVIDAAKVRAHSLQKTLLTAPYSLIAADANRDGKVNVLDVSIINQIVLTKLTAFPNNTSWRFLPKSLDISSDPVKKDWPDYIDLNQSNLDFNNLDFVSIKVGDVDHNSLLQDPIIEHRGLALALTIPDTIVPPSSNIQIPVRVSGPDGILAIQMTINYDSTQVDFQSITSSTIPDFGAQHYNDLGGQVIIVWDHPQGLDFQPDGTLMTLNFINKVNTGTSALTMSDISYYDAAFNEIPVTSNNGSITFMPSSTNEVVKRHKIKASPNPFLDQANIEINTEAPQPLLLTLRDVSGKVIRTVRSEKMNHHHIKINNLDYRGVIFIYIEGETFNDAIRLIKM